MDNIIHYATTHQFTVGVAVFVAFVIIYVVFKKLLKLALLLALLLIALGGYMYFKDPGKSPENIQQTLQKAKQQTVKVVEAGKSVYGKGKAVAEKGVTYSKELREFIKDGNESEKKR